MDVNYKKLLQQDKEFAKFMKQVNWMFIINMPDDALKAMYNFYLIGMSAKQTSDWIRKMQP